MKTISGDLFELIRSLTPAEKKYYKKSLAGIKGMGSNNLLLFEILNHQKQYDEAELKKKLRASTAFSSAAFHVAKNYLYNSLLRKMVHLHAENSLQGEMAEMIQGVHFLMMKSLYPQAYKLLRKAKKTARRYELFGDLIQLLQKESLLHYHTKLGRAFRKAGDTYVKELDEAVLKLQNLVRYSLFNQRMAAVYFRRRTQTGTHDLRHAENMLKDPLLKDVRHARSAEARRQYCLFHYTYAYLAGDEKATAHFGKMHFETFDRYPHLKVFNPLAYVGAIINMRNHLHTRSRGDAGYYHKRLSRVHEEIPRSRMDKQIRDRIFLAKYEYELNNALLQKSYKAVPGLAAAMEEPIRKIEGTTNVQLAVHVCYNMVTALMAVPEFRTARSWITILKNMTGPGMREDISACVRILEIIAWYELGEQYYLPYLTQSGSRYLKKIGRLGGFEREIIAVVNRLSKGNAEGEPERKRLEASVKKLELWRKDPLYNEYFDVFDPVQWVKSKTDGASSGRRRLSSRTG